MTRGKLSVKVEQLAITIYRIVYTRHHSRIEDHRYLSTFLATASEA